VGVAQKKPAEQGFDKAVALPAAVQYPAPQLPHDACDVCVMPPCENVPAAHGFAVGEPVATGQKNPAGHGACCWLAVADAHT
jgi:hypothetical protein